MKIIKLMKINEKQYLQLLFRENKIAVNNVAYFIYEKVIWLHRLVQDAIPSNKARDK